MIDAIDLFNICLFIQDNLDSDLSLLFLAQTAGLSRFRFHRVFKAWRGETLHEFVTRMRMERAAFELSYPLPRSNRRSIKAIAVASGYKRLSSFSHAFSSYARLSPRAYRNRALRGRGGDVFAQRGCDAARAFAPFAIGVRNEPARRIAVIEHGGNRQESVAKNHDARRTSAPLPRLPRKSMASSPCPACSCVRASMRCRRGALPARPASASPKKSGRANNPTAAAPSRRAVCSNFPPGATRSSKDMGHSPSCTGRGGAASTPGSRRAASVRVRTGCTRAFTDDCRAVCWTRSGSRCMCRSSRPSRQCCPVARPVGSQGFTDEHFLQSAIDSFAGSISASRNSHACCMCHPRAIRAGWQFIEPRASVHESRACIHREERRQSP